MSAFWINVGLGTAAAIVAAIVVPVAVFAVKAFMRMRGHRAVMFAFAAGAILYGGAKHGAPSVPVIEKPVWLSVSSVVDTNTWNKATFTIGASGLVDPLAAFYIDVALPGQATTNWTELVATIWGQRPGEVSFASLSPSNPTNYIARIRCDYSPTEIHINDFAALAATTDRFVSCSFTAPTNLVGKAGYIDVCESAERLVWQTVKTFTVATNNTVTIRGNYISRGQDRKFRVRVKGTIYTMGAIE